MDSKEQLIKNIQDWVRLDNEIRKLKKEEQTRKEDQKKISVVLMEIMKTNQIDEVDINNGKLIYSKKNVKKPITTRILLSILSKFYKGDIPQREDLYKEEVLSTMTYLKLKKVKRLMIENQADLENDNNEEDTMILLQTHLHLKQAEMELMKTIGTVIFR